MYYRKEKKSKWFKSLIGYLRDIFVSVIPVLKIPKFIIKFLYGNKIDFVFFVHARRSQDFFVSIPSLTIIRRLLGKKRFLRMMSFFPGKVVSSVTTPSNKHGIVLVSPLMPSAVGLSRQKALEEVKKMLSFSKKISGERLVVGLGGWWPIVTNRGKYIKRLDSNVEITIGHTVTVLSICLTLNKIAILGKIPKRDLSIMLIGAGKIGSQVADILIKEGVQNIAFIDINKSKLNKLYLQYNKLIKKVEVYNLNNLNCSKKEILNKYHVAVCATSTSQEIIKQEDIPSNYIIVDDSRPEAITRNIKDKDKVVLEGGLMKIDGLMNDYDYGFGKDENFFGCFCETYILAEDNKQMVRPTIGDIKYENYLQYKKYCSENSIYEGDFKTAEKTFSNADIISLMEKRKEYLRKT